MKKTDKLYDIDSYMSTFDALVLSCEKYEGGYNIVLDRTAFFPEEGGQTADTGVIGNAKVLNVKEKDGILFHYCDLPLEVGKVHTAHLDFDARFDKMQNHTGEHIVSGITHSLYGYENVGFHLSDNLVSLDFDGPLTREQLDKIEVLANRAICENVPIKAYYPSSQELKKINYRSKLDLEENVRIVTIEGYDNCACCAPHLKTSGEVGIIKLLDFEKHKNGVRIYIKCGMRALCDYRERYHSTQKISQLLCSKQDEVALSVAALCEEKEEMKYKMGGLQKKVIDYAIKSITPPEENLIVFEDDLDADNMRYYANGATPLCKIFAIFVGKDGNYNYICSSKSENMKGFAVSLNKSLNGRGGGSERMIQGTVYADKNQIKSFFMLTNE